MNTNGPDDRHDDPAIPVDDTGHLPGALRFRLRALRADVEPAGDLWPGIASRLASRDALQARPARPRWVVPVAMAASLLAVVALVGAPWRTAPGPATAVDDASPALAASAPPPVLEGYRPEAVGLSRQYRAAFREIDTLGTDPSMQPVLDDLDRNATLILDALAEQPDSRLLLEQLRRTYAHRLAVSQRTLDT